MWVFVSIETATQLNNLAQWSEALGTQSFRRLEVGKAWLRL